MCVQAVLPLPWRWGHKSRLRLLHRGAVIYACPAGIVNFFFFNVQNLSQPGRVGCVWLALEEQVAVRPACDAPPRPTGTVPRALDPAAQPGSAELLSDQREGFQKPGADAHSGDRNTVLFLRPVLPPVSLG